MIKVSNLFICSIPAVATKSMSVHDFRILNLGQGVRTKGRVSEPRAGCPNLGHATLI